MADSDISTDLIPDHCLGLFNEDPEPGELHPVIYLRYFGALLMKNRRSQPKSVSSSENWGRHLSVYTGKRIDRHRISRSEKGDTKVAWEVYAAQLFEMGVFPEMIGAIVPSECRDTKTLLLLDHNAPAHLKQITANRIKNLISEEETDV